ncbi:MAG: HAD-IA family hydrolase [Deltaproteobacteria bacterium]|nr:HAD-IA family hydrolase [Deltaproteobacteria bacterium]
METPAPNQIKMVLFDFDGTLTKPGALDFDEIKAAIGCPHEIPVLEYMRGITDPVRRQEVSDILDTFETRGAEISEPNTGAEAIIPYLKEQGILVGILTRNTLKTVIRALENFEATGISDFDLVITRDDQLKPKPHPEGILWAAEEMGIKPEDILMVGDFAFDMEAGKKAGAITVFLDNHGKQRAEVERAFSISTLEELKEIIEMGYPLPAGKLPNHYLRRFLSEFAFEDPSVLIGPAVGEDTAAVDIQGEEVLVLKSDPVTFVTDSIGLYAVLVSANDIATSGAIPRWMLTTLLFPVGTSALTIHGVMENLYSICRKHGMTLCGGHTEITEAVQKPVVSGMMAGTVKKSRLIEKSNMAPGDVVLMTKRVAVEGTAIIAREFGEKLRELGLSPDEIALCRDFLPRISILKEARIAACCDGVSAMHDVTEGGLATAVSELSMAGGCSIKIRMEDIPVYPITRKICSLFDISPLGLIGSGSLLICCRKEHVDDLLKNIRDADIEVTSIGDVLEKGTGVDATRNGEPTTWPTFPADEITRLP